MKKSLKYFSFLIVFILSITALSACSNKPDLTPAQAAILFTDVVTQKEGALEAANDYWPGFADEFNIDTLKKDAVSEFNLSQISDEKANEFIDSMFNAMQKAEYSAEDGENGLVILTVRGVDFNKISENATKKLTDNAGKYSTYEEGVDAMIDFMIAGLEDAQLVSEAKTLELQFKEENGRWIPSNPFSLGADIATALLGM